MPDWRQIARERVFTLGLDARREAGLVDELAGQMEEIHAAAVEDGETAGQALRRALAALPSAGDFARQGLLAGLPPGLLGRLRLDAGFGLRLYTKQPVFLWMAILAIGVGIGACTMVFSLLEAVVLRPLDYRQPEELVLVWERFRGGADNVVSPANYLAWRQQTNVLADASPVISLTRNLVGVGEPVELGIEAVGWNYLRMLGVEPQLGRDFVPDDDRPETPAAVLLSHRLWRSRFGGNTSVVGRHLRLDGLEAVVVGVLPAGFASLSEDPDLLTTARLDAAVDYRPRGRFMRAVGRLKTDLAAAQQQISAVARRLAGEDPRFNQGWDVHLVRLEDHFSRRARGGLWMLMAAVAFVLLIVCGNVANLLLARVSQRERELAVRWALGAAPARLAAQLLTESLLLASLGGALGCALAAAGIQLVRNAAPLEIPRLQNAGLDGRALGFALVVTAVSAIVFGLAPALSAWRLSPAESLKEGARTLAGTRQGRLWRSAFVIAQTALTLVLLLGAGTLIDQFRKLLAVDAGFDPRGVLTMSLLLPDTRYGEPHQVAGFFAELERRLRRMPEVERVGSVAWLPLAGPGAGTSVWVHGQPKPNPGDAVVADVRMATPGYFSAMGVRLEAGRWFEDRDRQRLVVSRALARALFPAGDAVGRKLVVNMRNHDAPAEIVGVVGDVRHSGLETAPRPMVYYAHADFAMPMMTVVMRAKGAVAMRTQGDAVMRAPGNIARTAIATVREMDPEQPVRSVRSMEEWIGRSLAERRWLAGGCGAFAALAVALACMGIYGAFAQVAAERRHELGVRLALGADRADVLWLLTRQAAGLIGAGVALGLLFQRIPARVWGLSPSAEITAVMIFAFVSLAMAAMALSARQALHLDPLVVLRQE